MSAIEKTIDVDVPVRTAYNQWTQFEEFPLFMEGVKEVRQLNDKQLFWRAEVLGKEVEWTAEIAQQIPDSRIAWHSTAGTKNAGSISFLPMSANRTRLILRIDYEPEGAAQETANVLGLISARVDGDLKRFKKFIEERGRETGAWRGEIQGKHVTSPHNERAAE